MKVERSSSALEKSIAARNTQYDFAQTTRRALGSPVKMHFPDSASPKGITRIVTFKSRLDLFLDLARAVPMRQRKAAMNFRFLRILGVKKS